MMEKVAIVDVYDLLKVKNCKNQEFTKEILLHETQGFHLFFFILLDILGRVNKIRSNFQNAHQEFLCQSHGSIYGHDLTC